MDYWISKESWIFDDPRFQKQKGGFDIHDNPRLQIMEMDHLDL